MVNTAERSAEVRKERGNFPLHLATVAGALGESHCGGSVEEEAGLPCAGAEWEEVRKSLPPASHLSCGRLNNPLGLSEPPFFKTWK